MKKEFNLEEWLKNKDRKVVTRDGKLVRIVCWDNAAEGMPIIVSDGGEYPWTVNESGRFLPLKGEETENDIFFEDSEEEKEEELNEFEKELAGILFEREFSGKVETEDDLREGEKKYEEVAKQISSRLLDAARKVIEENNYIVPTDDSVFARGYRIGKTEGISVCRKEALKELPKWKKDDNHLSTGVY